MAELFHAPDGTAYADIVVAGHRETWPVRSKGFAHWLARRLHEQSGDVLTADVLRSVMTTLEARARFDGPCREVYVRVAEVAGCIYLDLAGPDWNVIEVGPNGWRPISESPVRFRRTPGMLPLPMPQSGGSIEALHTLLNLRDDDDFVGVVAWLLGTLRGRGPYPPLVLRGEQGSAKTTCSGLLRAVIDPNTAPLRALPRRERDLFISAANGHILAFDNLSRIRKAVSDNLCRISTGGGYATRELYTDRDETLFDVARPMILNGIDQFVTEPDLADRCLFVELSPISAERRRPLEAISNEFERARPRILGALLDGAAHGLRALPTTVVRNLPRMADFALWVTACEGCFWPAGRFLERYHRSPVHAAGVPETYHRAGVPHEPAAHGEPGRRTPGGTRVTVSVEIGP